MNGVGMMLGAGGLTKATLLDGVGFDPGRVGAVTGGDGTVLDVLLGAGFVPVISSIAFDHAGAPLNINADCAAAAVETDVAGPKVGRAAVSTLESSEAAEPLEATSAPTPMPASTNPITPPSIRQIEPVFTVASSLPLVPTPRTPSPPRSLMYASEARRVQLVAVSHGTPGRRFQVSSYRTPVR